MEAADDDTDDGVRVLVVGADPARAASIAGRLRATGLVCESAQASPPAWRGGLLRSPDVIVAIEVGGSWQPTRGLLDREAGPSCPPVLVLADGVSAGERATTMAAPAGSVQDWVDVSCETREIAGRIVRLARVHRQAAELEELRRRGAALDGTDRLTGLAGHRLFHEWLGKEFRRSARYGRPLSLVLIDIDRLRSLNDEGGHLWGDRIIQEVARRVRGAVREVDLAARLGGDDFALVLPDTPAEGAGKIAGRLAAALSEPFAPPARPEEADAGPPSRVTASLGMATFPGAGVATSAQLLSAAQTALGRAKDEGRNRAIVAPPVVPVREPLTGEARPA